LLVYIYEPVIIIWYLFYKKNTIAIIALIVAIWLL